MSVGRRPLPGQAMGLLALALIAGCASAPDVPLPSSDHGELVLDVEPRSTEVYLDGVRVGIAREFDGRGRALVLEPGPHVLMLRKAGYATYRGAVRSQAGRREVLQVVLERIGD